MRFASLSARNLKEIYRDPVSLLLGLGLPLALLVLFSSIYKKAQIEMFSPQMLTPGIIIFCFAFLIMFSSVLLARDHESALLIRLFTTPLRPSGFIIAYILPFLPLAMFQILVCIITGSLLGASFQNIIPVCVIFISAAFICICLGMILGSLFSVNQVSGVGSVLVTAIGLFCGAWTPLKIMGGVFESAGYALPFAHAVDAARLLMSGSSFSDIQGNFWNITVWSVVLFIVAIMAFRWRMKRL